MSISFDPQGRLVLVPVTLVGPRGPHHFRFAVDTAATRSAASPMTFEVIGYRQSEVTGNYQVRTGSGGNRTGFITVMSLTALDQTKTAFPLVWQPIPPGAMVDGLLGLDFFRGRVLTLDFAHGRITLRPPRRWWPIWH